jgi:hypothetical protein
LLRDSSFVGNIRQAVPFGPFIWVNSGPASGGGGAAGYVVAAATWRASS